ncbi:MAG: WS/DGAT domain-containing protein, partial [Acidimicrobiales bacterium]
FNPPSNLVISNVPGPRHPLYLDGAEMQHYFPVSTIGESQGLNITLQSYRDIVDFALVACRELVPDVEWVADLLTEEIQVLADAVGVKVHGASPSDAS